MPRLFMGPHAIGIFTSKLFGHFIIAGDTFNAFHSFNHFSNNSQYLKFLNFLTSLFPDSVNADPVKRQDGASEGLRPALARAAVLLSFLSLLLSRLSLPSFLVS